MNKIEAEDELQPEYDVQYLQVRKLGHKRKTFGDTVRLEPNVVAAFPNADTQSTSPTIRASSAVCRETNY